ncbi:flagellar export chaperone FlgN [Pseudarthrobacter sp. lyk4-40-TYG-27]|uniref:flagellar export chaperone FlgN n=1 Tax=Pseudarthrobacter sp. lyk4-40-TYG-27 TaxID=3040305 RepID=UPI00330619E4
MYCHAKDAADFASPRRQNSIVIGEPLGADGLSATLWRERRQLELLNFRLETQLLYLGTGKTQWLTFTSADLEAVLEKLRFETLARNVEAAAVAAEWGVPGEPDLQRLAAAAPEGIWGELLLDHRRDMALLLQHIQSAIEANREALKSALEGVARDLDAVASSPDPAEELAILARQANAAHALAVVENCGQPLVAEFLGATE